MMNEMFGMVGSDSMIAEEKNAVLEMAEQFGCGAMVSDFLAEVPTKNAVNFYLVTDWTDSYIVKLTDEEIAVYEKFLEMGIIKDVVIQPVEVRE